MRNYPSKGSMRRLLAPIPIAVICGVAALLALLGYGLAASKPDREIDRAVARGERKPAPAFELPHLTGAGRSSLASYRGKVVLLNVWASWCVPCRQESPLLERWQRRMQRSGGTVLGVDVLDVTGDARDFVARYRLTYPQLRDGGGDTLSRYGVVAYPESFVIDRRGRIAATRRGPVDESFLRRYVLPLLREPS
jgi:cytochrome c biogenesis protein CcmG/thiol:disulfide interchange protein DsbE